MKKTYIFMVFAFLLAACQSRAPVETQVATSTLAQASPTATVAIQPTSTPPSSATAEPTNPPGCTAVSPRPTPGPTEASLFPPVGPKDWVQGPEDANVTLIEYSDFQ